MPRPVHFEIHASDPTVAQAFYAAVFGWRFQQWGEWPYWEVTTATEGEDAAFGIDGGLVHRRGAAPAHDQSVSSFVVTVEVQDCAGYVERAVGAGGSVAVPLGAVPGVGWVAYVKDPDGNLLGLMQVDPAAA